MKDIYLDVNVLNTRGYDYLKEIFDFPDHFRHDPESLYDCLDALSNLYIHLENAGSINEFSEELIEVILEVAEFDPSILVV